MNDQPERLPSIVSTMPTSDAVGNALIAFLDRTAGVSASEMAQMARVAADLLDATSSRLLIADYSMLSMRELGDDGPVGPRELIARTLAGRALAGGKVVSAEQRDWIPLTDGSERLGVLEITRRTAAPLDDATVHAVSHALGLALISARRYSDLLSRTRRSERLSLAAEMQWGLLPPLSLSERNVSISGILEPAYSIGGDSFDYAVNSGVAEFTIVDAVGHGMDAVLISIVAINGLRNARREGKGHEAAYRETGEAIAKQFGRSAFATAHIASLELESGLLTWLNAGHPPPLLVRNGRYAGEMQCEPSLPMGLHGSVAEVAVVHLQPGDRVLFYTDGVTETKSADRSEFGLPRLSDFLVRSTLQDASPVETLRQLSNAVLEYSDTGLSDDATLLLVEYHGSDVTL